ncbi:GIY-YIG nuclease family protein [Solitalea koreensis]|uniref:Putative endonuclease n=1 Tax=Solitalea koreensis TaxID=543615 RepID=A0A521BF70_9SPHI|nr:GIY-YIG nuclease family protein [Solitalea koreensis]SMO45757.1 putative endonuclease [Solitalea koreensis]
MFRNLNSSVSFSIKGFIYFMTDRNRSIITVGYTDNLYKTVNIYRNTAELFVDENKKSMRLVYFEQYDNEVLLKKRCDELQRLTKAQRERIIRTVNPNWNDLSIKITSNEIIDLSILNIQSGKLIEPLR